MNELNKYFDYLRKDYKKKIEQKKDIDKLISKTKKIIEQLNNDLNLVNETELKDILERIEAIDSVETIKRFNNIKIISGYFSDNIFNKQPQIIAAIDELNKLKKVIESYLNALELIIKNNELNNLEEYQKYIELVEKINRQEIISSEELKFFYQKILGEKREQEEVNEIIIGVFNYLSKMLIEKETKLDKEEENKNEEKKEDVIEVIEDSKKEIDKDSLTDEEFKKIEKVKEKISVILKLAHISQLEINKINSLLECIEGNLELPKDFIEGVKNIVGLDLTYENVKLLDELCDILEHNDEDKFVIFKSEIRSLLDKFDNIFHDTDKNENNEEDENDEKKELLNILNNPHSLVVFMTNESTLGMVSYAEEDYEREIKNRDRKKTKTSVKKIITQLYTGNVEVRFDGDNAKFFGNTKMRVLHDIPERDMRCFFGVLPVSETVKKYLCDTYNIRKDDLKNFRVYLYTGFGHIGNHESNYADEYYNRCNLSLNVNQVKRLISLFKKDELTNDDKIEIDNLINCGFDIAMKLNNVERKKRYE